LDRAEFTRLTYRPTDRHLEERPNETAVEVSNRYDERQLASVE
jgi:hypothetical protein